METSGVTPNVAVDAPELAALVQSGGPFATVYLTTEGAVENAAQRSEQHWKTLRAELAEASAPEAVLEAVDPLVADAHLHGRCLAVVAGADGVVHVEHGPYPLPRDLARWAPLPSLVPLLDWRQEDPPRVVVLADRQGADLAAYRRSGPDLHREAGGLTDPVAKSAPGGWSQRKYQQRAENTWEQNAQDVAEQVTRLVDRVGARLVIVAGDVRAVQLLREALPREVSELLSEVPGGRSPDGSADMVAEEADRALTETVARDTSALVEKLREELGQGDRAVEGAERTLEALAMAQVEVLLVHDDVFDDRRAWFGPEPAHVSAHEGTLRELGVEPRPARLVDVAVRAALATGAGVRVVPPAEAPPDGLGAILRWSGGAGAAS